MTADELRSLQAPLKAQYRERSETALVTLQAEGRIGENMTCKIERERRGLKPGFILPQAVMARAHVRQTCCSKR